VDRNPKVIRDADGPVLANSLSLPNLIPDYLALVGVQRGRYPGRAGTGAKGSGRSCCTAMQYSKTFPSGISGRASWSRAVYSRSWQTLPHRRPMFAKLDEVRWRGPTDNFANFQQRLGGRCPSARAPVSGATPRGKECMRQNRMTVVVLVFGSVSSSWF